MERLGKQRCPLRSHQGRHRGQPLHRPSVATPNIFLSVEPNGLVPGTDMILILQGIQRSGDIPVPDKCRYTSVLPTFLYQSPDTFTL